MRNILRITCKSTRKSWMVIGKQSLDISDPDRLTRYTQDNFDEQQGSGNFPEKEENIFDADLGHCQNCWSKLEM